MINVDGSYGEGGGQILRSALALSMVTRKAFTIENIRARRSRAGLAGGHLLAIDAAQQVCKAKVTGNQVGSKKIKFEPGITIPGWYEFAAGSRGSASLVLQTIMPSLMTAAGPSVLKFSGGTDVPQSPPVRFFKQTFLPHLQKLGPSLKVVLDAPGYYPAGGGRLNVEIEPKRKLDTTPLDLTSRGELLERKCHIVIANLSQNTARRQTEAFIAESGWDESAISVEDIEQLKGPGNMVSVMLRFEHMTEIITCFGQMGDPPEKAARQAASEAAFFMNAQAAVGEHLADQLLLPMAMAGGGKMTTTSPSRHTRTNIHVISQFMDNVKFIVEPHGEKAWMIQVKKS